jgi:ubiquinone/menaquinone biosynthesis C-methylase UbiE
MNYIIHMSFDINQYKSAQRQGWDCAASGWNYWWKVIEKGAQKINDRLIDLAKIKQGDSVLDLATGIGEPAVTVAKIVGSQGHVLAVDISPQMLAIARQRAATDKYLEGLQHIVEFKESDIESLSLPSLSIDAVLCRWGLMFLPNLDSALTNIFNTLKNGGRIATAVWSSQSKTPFVGFPMSIIMRELNISYSTVSPYPENRVLGPCSLADEKILKDSLQKAGFKDIQVERQNVTFEFDSVNDYVNHVKDIAAPLNAIMEKESANRQDEIWKVVTKEVQGNYTNTADGSVKMDNECICFVGTK